MHLKCIGLHAGRIKEGPVKGVCIKDGPVKGLRVHVMLLNACTFEALAL